MDLSVIIVNFNVRQFLENSLTSIQRAMEGIDGEIFVVDNASDDGSVEMIRKNFPGVRLIENYENVGFARANNAALKCVTGKFFLLINPDTIVQEDTLRVMVKFFDENVDVGLAGCKILNPDGSFQLPCRRSFPTPWVAFTKIIGLSTLFPKSKLFGRYNLTYLSPDETYEVEALSGSFMMGRREAYEKVGGLDETFFMYGEDLDWCYRFSTAGYKVCYVHSTKIVHFKGESTRRSDLDEIKLFYQAMHRFVEKHLSRSAAVEVLLTLAIIIRAAMAFLAKASRPLLLVAADFILVDLALLLGYYIYFGRVFHFPDYAYPVVWTVPPLIVVASMYFSGAYTTRRHSVIRAGMAVAASYVLISAIIYFAKEFAFSRAVVLISGVIAFVLLPGWRVAVRRFGRGAHSAGRKSLFGRRTLIVGTGRSAQEVLRKLRVRVDDGYDVLGFIGMQRREIGEKIAGVDVIGSIDNVGKVIKERNVGEVIFSTDGLSYTDMLSVISRSNSRDVNFRLVPNSLEAIIGKTRIDQLDNIPLVDIEYNIHRSVNRVAKRMFDICVSVLLFCFAYPFAYFGRKMKGEKNLGRVATQILLLPKVFLGSLSIVGRPLTDSDTTALPGRDKRALQSLYLGPVGLTGLVQINRRDGLEPEEVERYKLYYAKNQSLVLDLEIIAKSLLLLLRK